MAYKYNFLSYSNFCLASNSTSEIYVTASVASCSMTTGSAMCFKSVLNTVEFRDNKAISQILFTLRCHKNGVGAEKAIGLLVGRYNAFVSFSSFQRCVA